MSANNDKFRRGMKASIDKSKDKLGIAIRRFILEANNRMIMRSPVGNPDLWSSPAPSGYVGGTFKGNWMVGDGRINTSTSNQPSTSRYGQIANYNMADINGIKINGQTVYITNSLPYSRRLEYDEWSKQAPMGMVRVTIAELKPIMTKIALEVRAS